MSTTPPSAQLIMLSDLHEPAAVGPEAAPIADLASSLQRVRARLQVCVGDTVITVGELMQLREHQVLSLNQAIEAPVDVLLEGAVIARGHLVAIDDQFGVRITEVPLPLQP